MRTRSHGIRRSGEPANEPANEQARLILRHLRARLFCTGGRDSRGVEPNANVKTLGGLAALQTPLLSKGLRSLDTPT